MSIKSNAEEIRDETVLGANTATRVGGNLVEIADDLIAKQAEIDLNTNKISFDSTSSTRLANTSGTNTGDQDISIKQNTLVSATNIKTINGNTLLGSGDLVIVTSGGITGSGTVNKLSKFTASGVVGDSLIFDNASNVGIGTTTPPHNLTLSSPNSSTELGLYNTNTASASNRNWLIGTTYQNFGDLNFFVSNTAGGNPKASPPKISISTAGRVMIGTSVDNGNDALQVNGSLIATTLKTSGFTVATLPAPPAQGEGARAYVTDALNPTYLGTLTGGGTVKCPVFYNGTSWVSA